MQDTKFLLEPVRDVVAACRAASPAKIVVGGAGYSIFPEAALALPGRRLRRLRRGRGGLSRAVGAAPAGPGCRGAARGSMSAAASHRRPGSSPRIWTCLPLPEADLWASADPKDPEVWVPVQTRRGCPLACSYCSTPELEGTEVRMRSPAHGRRAYRPGGRGRLPQALLRGQHLQPPALLRLGIVPPAGRAAAGPGLAVHLVSAPGLRGVGGGDGRRQAASR